MTLEQLNEYIEEQNDLFLSGSDAEKRVRIAEDCLIRIELGRLKPACGKIVKFVGTVPSYSTSLKDEIAKGVSCYTCAKGALFMSYVGRTNQFKTGEISYNLNDHNASEIQKLLEIFSERQLSLIEYAFEGKQYVKEDSKGESINFDQETHDRVEIFFDRYEDNSEERMIAICDNIIINEGMFII